MASPLGPATRIDEWTWTVPSLSETDLLGNPVARIVTEEDDGHGTMVLRCDCESGALGFRRAVCRHVRSVAAALQHESRTHGAPRR